jgi:23S rRNA pseudouridine2605 synthase
MKTERLQKILARGGLASRRHAEALITEGRVRVNGRVVTELGTKADPRHDRIEVDGKRVVAEHLVYFAMNKPRGFVTTMSDPEGRASIRDLLKPHAIEQRVFPIGRLDYQTSGILLLTNDGAFSDGLLHPKRAVPKTYVVKVQGVMQPKDIERWREGVQLDDGKTLAADAAFLRFEGDKTWFEITIREGRNQQIRRMGDATGFRVMRLSRVAFAGISVDGIRPGELRALTYEELVDLKKKFGVPKNPSVAHGADTEVKERKIPVSRMKQNVANDPHRTRTRSSTWGRDERENDRPQGARARHVFEGGDEGAAPAMREPRQGGWRGHGPDDRWPREVPRMPDDRRGKSRGSPRR